MPVTVNDLPIELLERIADWVALACVQDTVPTEFKGPSFVIPWSKASSGKQDLLRFSMVCRSFRLASLRHLPELVRDITIKSFSELEVIRDDAATRRRLEFVRHIVLDFTIPLYLTKLRIRKALAALCCHPSWPGKVFPQLEGISFTSRFLSGYAAHENTRRDWHAVARDTFGMTGWQAKVFGGFASFSAVLAGGQSMTERFGDCECLFLTWDDMQREVWTAGHDHLFRVSCAASFASGFYNNTSSFRNICLRL
jgi:hypothetical protein